MTLCIGLTGGIGSGKSMVANLFANHGVPIIDMDKIAHQIVEPGHAALDEIVRCFGDSVLQQNGQLDRKKLRGLVFDKQEKRQQLEAILHPRIRQQAQQQIQTIDTPYCLIVIPLLFETNQRDLIQRILVVDTLPELQIKRTMQRDQCSAEQVENILHSQVDRQTRLSQADDIIDNTNDETSLQLQVDKLHQKYLSLAQRAS